MKIIFRLLLLLKLYAFFSYAKTHSLISLCVIGYYTFQTMHTSADLKELQSPEKASC